MITDNFSIFYFVTVLIRATIIKFRGHRGFNTKFSSPESPVCTTAVHCHNMNREMVVYKSLWTQRHKKDQWSEISTTGLRSRKSEGPRAFAGSALSECHFLVWGLHSFSTFSSDNCGYKHVLKVLYPKTGSLVVFELASEPNFKAFTKINFLGCIMIDQTGFQICHPSIHRISSCLPY